MHGAHFRADSSRRNWNPQVLPLHQFTYWFDYFDMCVRLGADRIYEEIQRISAKCSWNWDTTT